MGTRKQPNCSLTGRYEYLIALQSCWPEFWRGLATGVLNRVNASVFDQETWNAEFNRWASRWGVRDEWLLEAAWQTLCLWSKGNLRNRDPLRPWFFYGPEINIPLFQPALVDARPRVVPPAGVSFRIASAFRVQTGLAETVQQFAARMSRQFEQQLTDYCRAYEAVFTAYKRKPSLAEHADWTALYQSGKSPKEIETIVCSGTRRRLSHAAILSAISNFSRDIGLTLRQSTRGRTASRPASKARNIRPIR